MDIELQKKLVGARCKVSFNVSGASLSAYKSGGRIAAVISVKTENELCDSIQVLKSMNIEYKIVGNCSNILISDDGYDGVIIKTSGMNKIRAENNLIYAECGVKVNQLSRRCANDNLSGLEWATGIPACIGGAIYQNSGCYGHDIGELTVKVRMLEGMDIVEYENETMNFAYRHSIMSEKELVCLGAYFELKVGGYYEITALMDEYRTKRQFSQPKAPSLGSVFKRVGDKSAASFIDKLGLKGCCVGGAYVSNEHAGFICNNGFGTSEDYLHLARFIQREVMTKEGIFFPPEIEYIGKENETYQRLIGKIDN